MMKSHWIYESELRKYYEFEKFKGSFDIYKMNFLKEMEDAGIPHAIIKDDEENNTD